MEVYPFPGWGCLALILVGFHYGLVAHTGWRAVYGYRQGLNHLVAVPDVPDAGGLPDSGERLGGEGCWMESAYTLDNDGTRLAYRNRIGYGSPVFWVVLFFVTVLVFGWVFFRAAIPILVERMSS